ncbi:MAG: serine/threonine protein kinase [Planctomycetes bacterium]|nr:serine/threonine protein kinase [Planctomycetota bacterium]
MEKTNAPSMIDFSLGSLLVAILIAGPFGYWAMHANGSLAQAKDAPRETPALSKDWPLFRGNTLQTGVAGTTLPDKLEIRWKLDLKKGIESTAAIVDGIIYVGCYDDHLYAIELANGNVKWKTKLGSIKAAPSVYQGKVFVGDEDSMFYCVNAADGKKLWDFECDGAITGGANFSGDRVIFASHDANLYCLGIADKKLIWKIKTEGPVHGSVAVANGQTFFAGCDSHLHVIDVMDGKSINKVELSGQTAATASFGGDKLYVGNMNNEVQAIDIKGQKVQWAYTSKRAPNPFYSSPAITDKLVVIGSRDRKLHAIKRSDGSSAWVFSGDGWIESSPVIAGNRVYVGSNKGTFYVIDLEKGTEVQALLLGEGITASPAVANECLVIGTTDGLLYCLGKK